jgi:hypothetical protein
MHSGVGGSAGDEGDPAREAVAQKLRELPNEAPPPFDWSKLQRRMQTKSARGLVRGRAIAEHAEARARRALAVITSVAVIAVAVLVSSRIERGGGVPREMRPDAQGARLMQPGAQLSAAREIQADALLARANGAEQWLADRPDDSALVHVSTHLAVANLEDRIASMDDLLNSERLQHAYPSRLRALQLQRAQLVDSLAQVRYAEMLVEETP